MARLASLGDAYARAREPLDALTEDSVRSNEDFSAVLGVLPSLEQTLREQHATLFSDLDETVRATCAAYRDGAETVRERIREAVGRSRVLLNYLQTYAAHLVAGVADDCDCSTASLDTAVTALVIEDLCMDFRDTYCILGELYVAAIQARLEPGVALKRAASMATPRMAAFLRGFRRSTFFRESVAPRIRT